MLSHLLYFYKPLNTTNAVTSLCISPSPLRALQSSHGNNMSAFGVHITLDDVVGSFVVLCEPQTANLWNYCPYFEWNRTLYYND